MADIDLTLAINKLQALHRSISGVRYAPDLSAYPTVLDTANLPAVITWPVDGSWYMKGGGWKVDERTMLVLVYVQPLAQNDIPSNAAASVALLGRLREAYITYANALQATPDIDSGYQMTLNSGPERPMSDGGIEANLSFGGAAFYGARIRVNVHLQWGA